MVGLEGCSDSTRMLGVWSGEETGDEGMAIEVEGGRDWGGADTGTRVGLCVLVIVVGEFLVEEKHSSILKTRSLSATQEGHGVTCSSAWSCIR